MILSRRNQGGRDAQGLESVSARGSFDPRLPTFDLASSQCVPSSDKHDRRTRLSMGRACVRGGWPRTRTATMAVARD